MACGQREQQSTCLRGALSFGLGNCARVTIDSFFSRLPCTGMDAAGGMTREIDRSSVGEHRVVEIADV
jgi:hypothetical protein